MAEVIEVIGESSFKSQQDILEFNRTNFPQEPQKTEVVTIGTEDPMAALRSQMKQRIYSFNSTSKDSSSMKVAEFRAQFQELKEKIKTAKTEKQSSESNPTSYATLLHHLYNGSDLVSNIEGSH